MVEIARQRFLTIDPDAWPGIIAGHDSDILDTGILQQWAERRWPVVVRRPNCADAGAAVPIGIPLPPFLGKARVALAAPPCAILASAPPPLLRDAAMAAPRHWQATIATLLAALPAVRCFGGLAWQYLTLLPYLTEASDLDLIVECDDHDAANQAGLALQEIAGAAKPGLDGELIAANGDAVHWREWMSGAAMVIVKSRDARLEQRERIFA